jgi:hypothetical protein
MMYTCLSDLLSLAEMFARRLSRPHLSRLYVAHSRLCDHIPIKLLRWNTSSESTSPLGRFSTILTLTPQLPSLGKSGLKVSKVILGAMSYGDPAWQEWVLKEEEALPLLEHAYKVGINTWDTVHNLT